MTAEIAIMNKTAVALAADSAVTISLNEEPKVFQTVNKLFSLSKYHPVGLMVYGIADFMQVDWETIVKVYRGQLGHRAFETLHDHAYDFLTFLHTNHELFDEDSQRTFVEQKIVLEFSSIRDLGVRIVEQEIQKSGHVTPPVIRESLRSIVTSRRAQLNKQPNIKLVDGATLSSKRLQGIRREYMPTIDRIKGVVFERLPLDSGISRKLNDIAIYILTKEDSPSRQSGVVVAGYGKRQIFPALEEFGVDGVFSNMLKFNRRRSYSVGRETTASIIPFAQSEMVYAFMEGVDPEYQGHIETSMQKTLDAYSSTLLDLFVPDPKSQDRYRQAVSEANVKVRENLAEDMKKYRFEQLVQPVVRIVQRLPKSELGAMAESLVNLTSFRRHVTPDAGQ